MIAISYRREDSLPIAGRLYDRLQAKFGKKNVFMDFDSIPPGADFRQHIDFTPTVKPSVSLAPSVEPLSPLPLASVQPTPLVEQNSQPPAAKPSLSPSAPPNDTGAQKLTRVKVKKYGLFVLLPLDVFPDFEILSNGGFSLTHDLASVNFYDSDKSLRQTYEDHVAGFAAELNQNIDYKVLKDAWFVVSGTFGLPGKRAGFYTKGVKKGKNVIMMELHYSEENYQFADDTLTAISRSFDGN